MVLGIVPVAIIDRQLPFEYIITSKSTDVVVMAHPVQNINHSAFRSMFKREKISGNNFIDWFHQLKSVLRVEKKMFVIEQPIPPAPATDFDANVLAEWNALYDVHNEVACLMLGSMTPELHRKFENYSPYEMLKEISSIFEKQAGVERFDLIQIFHACKQEEGKSVAAYVLQMKGYVDQLERLGYVLPQDIIVGLILNGLTKDFVGFVRNYNMHNMGKTIGELHAMLIDPLRQVSRQGANYFIAFTDDYSRYGYIYLLKHKHEVFETFKVFKNKVENQLGKTIKALRSDRGDEYISQDFKDYLKAYGIVQQLTLPYTPQHNGVSERRNRTLLDMVRSMMNLITLPLSFWDYALESATRILNMVPTKNVDKNPYELWYGKVPNLSYLKVWGCEALVKRDTPEKLQQRSAKCIFIGYPKETMGYYFYFPPENKIVVSSYAEFFEKNLITQGVSERAIDLEEIQDEDTSPSEITSKIPMEVKEIQSMIDNMLWVFVDLPPGCKTVRSKWIFKKKTDMDCIVHTYKARLVAKGYTHLYEVDYEEMFSPVADIRAIRILISIAAFYDYEIWKIDVKSAFLNGYLDEDIYMVQPKGFVDLNHPRKVCKLQRSIYGLKQASKCWNKRFDKEIKRFVFAQNLDEPCVYQKASSVKDYLGKCFAMKDLGKAAFILGIKIYRDRSTRLIGLGQNAYMDKILKRYKMDNSKRGHIPMQEKLDLNRTQGASTPKEVKRMQNVPYASSAGSIMYAVRCTRPDVAFAQNITSRFQQNTEAEYIVASEAVMEAVWIRKFISGLGIVPTINEPIRMFCDNSAALHFANEPGVQKSTRHYHMRYHYVRESITLGEIRFLKVHTDDNLTDPFTKALCNTKLTQHARSMGLRLASSFM
nr:retrotransposon protein, putative, Ty1-copia subclass [Tanacetum cinerariifolium]